MLVRCELCLRGTSMMCCVLLADTLCAPAVGEVLPAEPPSPGVEPLPSREPVPEPKPLGAAVIGEKEK